MDEPIEVNFSGAAGNATDWIGLFKGSTCLAWRYTDGTYSGTAGITNGTVTFSGGLSSPDDYEARLFFNDSDNVEAADQFSVAYTSAEGTWTGTYHSNDGTTGPLTIILKAGGAVTIEWVEDLTNWEAKGTATIMLNGTYTYNSGTGELIVDVSGYKWLWVEHWDEDESEWNWYYVKIVAITDASGTVFGNNTASGGYFNDIEVYHEGSLVDSGTDSGTWAVTRP